MRTQSLLGVLCLTAVACSGAAETTVAVTEAPTSVVVAVTPPVTPAPTTASPTVAPTTTTTSSTTTVPPTTTTTTSTLPPTADLRLSERTRILGEISPKSVVASGDGFFIAQNMMYRHTMTVYDAAGELVTTIPDTVDLAAFGYDEYEGESYLGAPVEAAFTSDAAHVYVSNYQMYGEGFRRPGGDGCNLGAWDESFLYRIDTSVWEIDQVVAVGAVPKFLAVTPDDRYVVVSNWCSFDISVVDTAEGVEVARVDIGRHPRGIAISPDGLTAYVAIMGGRDIAVVDLETFTTTRISGVGAGPRHLLISPDGSTLYATLNGEGRIARIDLELGEVLAKVATGSAPRSMTISSDGASLYVVNYHSDTVSKVLTATMEEVQELGVGHHPIGISYDPLTGQVWVSSYSGSITVFDES